MEMDDHPICVITGGTSGIGRAAAHLLAKQGYSLVIVGRNQRRGKRARSEIKRYYDQIEVSFETADLASQDDTMELAKRIRDRYPTIDLLINNAGQRIDHYQEGENGWELTFTTNHLSHYILTNSLWKQLSRSNNGSVITITSSAHWQARSDYPWIAKEHEYDRKQSYAKSKLANLLFAFEFARRAEDTGIVSNAVDPGIAATRFASNNGHIAWAKHVFSHLVRGQLRSSKDCARSIAYLAKVKDKPNEKLIFGCKSVQASADAYKRELAKELWELSSNISGIDLQFNL